MSNNNIQNILNTIDSSNSIDVYLPDSKEVIKVKRYDLSSVNSISKLINHQDINNLLLNYGKFLIDTVKSKTENNLSFIDFNTVIIALRSEENNVYKNTDLNSILDTLKDFKGITFNSIVEIEENNILYKIELNLPCINRIKDILDISIKDAENSLLFYNIFKYVKNIEISTKDLKTTIESVSDLKSVYNVISYKVLNKISVSTSLIEKELYSLFKVNIETDTSFIYSI